MEFNMQTVMEIIFSIVGFVISYWGVAKLPQEKAKKAQEISKVVREATDVAVENIEQRASVEELTGTQKKMLAQNNAKAILKLMGYKNINEEMIDTYIESAVGIMNFFRKDKNPDSPVTDVSAKVTTAQK
jgi:LL-H family phage holin